MSSPRSTSTSPLSTFSSGGTPPSTFQHAQTQPSFDSPTFLSNDQLRSQLNEYHQLSIKDRAYTGKHIDNIEHQTAIQAPVSRSPSDLDSASPSVFQSAASSSPLSTLNEHYSSPSNTNFPFCPANVSTRSSRMRELSAPLPSAPPCTPASIVTRQSSLTQFRRSMNSPSSMRNAPSSASFASVFHSPVAESDVENFEPDSGDSDSNSVEIMTGDDPNPFSVRFTRTSSSNLRSMAYPSQPESRSNAPSPSPSLINNHVANLSLGAQDSLSSSASQTPTPHPLTRDRRSPEQVEAAQQDLRDSLTIGAAQTAQSPSEAQSPSTFDAMIRHSVCRSSLSGKENDEIVLGPLMDSAPLADTKADEMEDDSTKVPNIYVNGLPPNFPDESLYLMCRDFGKVLSVRTFTRCVGEKMSGYGFVLFDSTDAAERCIEALKKYRNLHPSFSKQIHKIPGTQFSSGPITLPPVGSLSSLASQPSLPSLGSFPSMASTLVSSMSAPAMHNHMSPSNSRIVVSDSLSSKIGPDFNQLSFREKMERLRDENSTNLYMEGLPLTVDETSLAALVSPHKILSSRFFQTKLSNPPRMIAFVRLDTRAGAEEVIERIHSRVVRGWNDNGCRISVRFADTNEQRELRRTERKHGMDDEESEGSQISMAHAALLNRRGAEAHQHVGGLKPSFSYHDVDQFGGRMKYGDPRSKGLRTDDVNSGYAAHRSVENPLLLSNVPFQGMSGFGNDGLALNELSSNDLALLQHQTQMQQLQLLQQMQGSQMRMDWNGFDQNYVRDLQYYGHAHSLMPSADIMQADVFPFDSVLPSGNAAAPALGLGHGRGRSASKTTPHSATISKGASAYGRNDAGQFGVMHIEEGFAGHHDPHGVGSDSATHGRTYSSDLLRSGGERHERLHGSDRRRAITFVEEGEIAAISPALTYASRTPSTLSPATPLFNTFNTPASVPATVPRSKPSVRERDFSRSYKTEFRQ